MDEKHGEIIQVDWYNDPDFEVIMGHVSHEEAEEALATIGWDMGGFELVFKWARDVKGKTKKSDPEFKLYDQPRKGRFPVTLAS